MAHPSICCLSSDPFMSTSTVEELRWLQAIESATFGVWDLDPRLDTVHYSPAWKAHLGFPRIHAPDATSFWRCRVHPGDVDPMLGSLRAHLDGHASSYAMRFRLRSNGSGYRTVLSRGRVVARDASGQAIRMVGTMVDLTGRPVPLTRYGLPSEDAGPTGAAQAMPLYAALGASPAAAAPDSQPLIEQIADLLDIALREGGTAA
jgi:PAS fold